MVEDPKVVLVRLRNLSSIRRILSIGLVHLCKCDLNVDGADRTDPISVWGNLDTRDIILVMRLVRQKKSLLRPLVCPVQVANFGRHY